MMVAAMVRTKTSSGEEDVGGVGAPHVVLECVHYHHRCDVIGFYDSRQLRPFMMTLSS